MNFFKSIYLFQWNSATLCSALFAVQIRWVDHDPSVESIFIETAAFGEIQAHSIPFSITQLDVSIVIRAHV